MGGNWRNLDSKGVMIVKCDKVLHSQFRVVEVCLDGMCMQHFIYGFEFDGRGTLKFGTDLEEVYRI